MTQQILLTFDDFQHLVADKRRDCIAMNDIDMMAFNAILYDSLSNEYLAKVRLKNEYNKDYKPRKQLVMMENTHLIHWAEWLDIGIIVKKHPNLIDKMMLVTNVRIRLDEPCFIDQPMEYCIKILLEKHKKDKTEFVFLNRINSWTIIHVDFTLVEQQMEILEHYHQKHINK